MLHARARGVDVRAGGGALNHKIGSVRIPVVLNFAAIINM